MKTREQIYGKEAAALLRDITTYRCIKHQQLLKLYPGKERQIDSLLVHLVRQGRVFHNTDTDTYFDSPDMQTDPDMLSALWVLADFSGRTDYHSSDEFPVKLIFFAAKGFGKEYAAGIKNGVSLAFKGSRNGKKMRFSWKHLKNYGKIQLQLWANIVRRITG